MKLTVKMAPDVTESFWLEESSAARFQRMVRGAVLLSCPCAGMAFFLNPELEFESTDDGVLLIRCEAISLDEQLELEGQTKGNGDLKLVIHDKCSALVIRMTIRDRDYSQIW